MGMEEGMSRRSELAFGYDKNSFPISANCRRCGEEMPKCDPSVIDSAEAVLWFAQQYLEHKLKKHASEDCEETPLGRKSINF